MTALLVRLICWSFDRIALVLGWFIRGPGKNQGSWDSSPTQQPAEASPGVNASLSETPALDPFLHSWDHSPISEKVNWRMADQVLWHEAYASFILEPHPPKTFGENDAD